MRRLLVPTVAASFIFLTGLAVEAQTQPTWNRTDQPQRVEPHRVRGEPQPHMQRALQALDEAEDQLQAASNDKGRHRVAALRAIRQAKREVREGIKFDNRN